MVIDTSAIMAILKGEVDRPLYAAAIQAASTRLISAATLVEAGIVACADRGELGLRELDEFLESINAEIVPVTAAHARIARDAFVRYGKGRHAARLNYGDCFTYALACASGHPLLFKGDDFSHTDIVAAPASRA